MITLHFDTPEDFKAYVGSGATRNKFLLESNMGHYSDVEIFVARDKFVFRFQEDGKTIQEVSIPIMTIRRFDFLVLAELTKAKKDHEANKPDAEEPTV